MKIRKLSILFLTALVLWSHPVISQDNRTLDTKVADLLVKMPAENQQQLSSYMDELLAIEEAGLQKILDLIIPPGIGDDTKARFAVESLSRYLSQPGREKEKLMWEAMVLDQIKMSVDSYVKSFLMSQLNYIGGDATISSLSKYFMDDRLFDPAIRAMRDADPVAAAKIFADHLNKTYGNAQIAMVNALGEIGIMAYANAVANIAGGNNSELQKSVLACLAKLGHPDSDGLLMTAAKNEQFLPEPTNATGSLLAYAKTLSGNGNRNLSLRICKTLEKKCTDQEQVHFKTHALIIAAGNDPIEKVTARLVKAMKDPNKSYRMAAIHYAAAHQSPVAPWLEALQSTKSSEVKSEILTLLGLLALEETADLLRGYLADGNARVRQEAVRSLTHILKEKAFDDVLSYTLAYPASPDTETAREALLQIAGKDQLQLLSDQLLSAPEGARVVLIDVIASREDKTYFAALLSHLNDGGLVRSSVLENLHLVSSSEHLHELLELFDRMERPDEAAHVELALVASVNDSPDRSNAIKTIIQYAGEGSSIEKFISVLGNVGGMDAVDALFQICSGDSEDSDKEAAFMSYLRIMRRSDIPADQKLLLLRKIEPFVSDAAAYRRLIASMGNVKTFLSFVTLSRYLEVDTLQVAAANALVNVVLPGGGLENGLSGKMVREKLIRARKLITGPESEYLITDIDNYLGEMGDEAGFVSMFNGRDLSGWQGLAADPVAKKKLSDKELEKLQLQANDKMLENWTVKDHCIVFNGDGANLCSIKEYGSFEMIVDWRITKKGDSGIYLRGSPQVQIWDISRVESGAQVGSGGLYNNQIHESKPLVVADNPVGEWNTFHITMTGERVTVYLNGQLVVDNVVMENYWDRSIPIFARGAIELQAHGTDLAFRDIYVRELETAGFELSEKEKEAGFVSLFNGRDLAGWTGQNHSYAVEDGNIVIRPAKGGGNLYTEKEYSDFVFRFEFKLTPGANNGLGIRAPLEGNAAYLGYELQILDNTAPVYANLEPYQYHGSVYGIIPSKRGFLNPIGTWNSQEVWILGDDIKITLNGTTILEGNIKEAAINGTPDGREHPGLKRTSGHIGFLGHGSLLWFRNIRIKELER